MLLFRVETPTGHYGVPQQTGTLAVCPTLPITSIAQMRGFLESMAGMEFETFEGEFAYGYARPPGGRGRLLRKSHVTSSQGGGQYSVVRPVHIEILFDLAYVVGVQGAWESLVRAALAGEVERYGNLYLGESVDLVTWMEEFQGNPNLVEWVTPGSEMLLPIRTGWQKNRIDTVYGRFSLRTGKPHWFTGKEGTP